MPILRNESDCDTCVTARAECAQRAHGENPWQAPLAVACSEPRANVCPDDRTSAGFQQNCDLTTNRPRNKPRNVAEPHICARTANILSPDHTFERRDVARPHVRAPERACTRPEPEKRLVVTFAGASALSSYPEIGKFARKGARGDTSYSKTMSPDGSFLAG